MMTLTITPSPIMFYDAAHPAGHTAEPWRISEYEGDEGQFWIEGAEGSLVQPDGTQDRAITCDIPTNQAPAVLDAERIVACVNFCAGFSTAWIEANTLQKVMTGETEAAEAGKGGG